MADRLYIMYGIKNTSTLIYESILIMIFSFIRDSMYVLYNNVGNYVG